MTDFDAVIIGGGVVGLACASRLASAFGSVLLLERAQGFGTETSSRNSGVIHAGLYYPTGSLKATLCVRGRRMLYSRCQRHGIDYRRCGKVVVAVDEGEEQALVALYRRALDNDAGDVQWLDGPALARREPRVRGRCGLWSPETGIVDVHALMDSYRREASDHGAVLLARSAVEGIAVDAKEVAVSVRDSASRELQTVTARCVVNAAGLGADYVARLSGLDVEQLGYRLHPCKGDYFALAPRLRGLVNHLVYPMPSAAGLGVHITFDLAGQLSAGPDTEYVSAPCYEVRADKAALFGAALRRYLPEIRDEDLSPNFAGVRPKLQGPSEAFRDFVIEEAGPHGCPGLINLVGLESPGLTASEAVAEEVLALARGLAHRMA